MHPDEFRALLKRLGISRDTLADYLRVHPVTARRWGTPKATQMHPHTSILLRLVEQGRVTLDEIKEMGR
jgi:DNA-binding transcriptional regulator YiaG